MAAATDRPWWERRGALLLVALAFAVPLAWPAIPPLTDAPGHMARYHIAIDRPAALARAFEYRWRLIGNLGVDLLVIPFAWLLGVERAAKLVIGLIPVLAAGGMLAAARTAHGRVPPTALFALPLVLGWPFQFGFLNYSLGMALAFWLLAGWILLAGRSLLRLALAVPASWLLWTAHSFAWALAGLMAFGAEVGLRRARGESWPRAVLFAGVHAAALTTPAVAMLGGELIGARTFWGFGWRIKVEQFGAALRDHWKAFDQLSVLLLAGVLVFAASHPRLRFRAVLALPAALLFAAFLACPGVLMGASWADTRIVPYALALALLAIPPARDPVLARGLAAAGATFAGIKVAAATASLFLAGRAYDRELAVLPHIPRGAAVFALVEHGCAPEWDDRRFDHLASVAILRRDAITNDQWAIPGQQLLTLAPARDTLADRDPSQLVGSAPCGLGRLVLGTAVSRVPWGGYDYLWTIGFPPGMLDEPWRVPVWGSERSALYRVRRDRPLTKP